MNFPGNSVGDKEISLENYLENYLELILTLIKGGIDLAGICDIIILTVLKW